MALFSSRYVQFATVAEVTYGTTPATPTFIIERFLPSDGPQTDKTTLAVEELHTDPNVREDLELRQDVSGSFSLILPTGSTNTDLWMTRFLRSTWSTDNMVNGDSRLPFTVERKHLNGAAVAYSRFVGQEVDKVSLMIEAAKELSATISLTGKSEGTIATSAIAGATYTAAETTALNTANSMVTNAFAGLSTLPKILSIRIDLDHRLQPQYQTGSKYRFDQVPGLLNISGQIVVYVETAQPGDVHNLGLNHTSGDVSFTVGSVAAKKYTFDLPGLRFMNSRITGSGQDGAVKVTSDFTARYDATATGSIKISRNVA